MQEQSETFGFIQEMMISDIWKHSFGEFMS